MSRLAAQCEVCNGPATVHLCDKHQAENDDRIMRLEARIKVLETAIKAVLRYISSHQIYDKDAKGVLERALAE